MVTDSFDHTLDKNKKLDQILFHIYILIHRENADGVLETTWEVPKLP